MKKHTSYILVHRIYYYRMTKYRENKTTILVDKEVRNRLKQIARKSQSYGDIITELIDRSMSEVK